MNENLKGLYYFLDNDIKGNPTIRLSSERLNTLAVMTFVDKVDRNRTGINNAEDIVSAVNSHQAMKEALEATLYSIRSLDEEYDLRESYVKGMQALTLANGGQPHDQI